MQQTNRLFNDKRIPGVLRNDINTLFRPLSFKEVANLKSEDEVWQKFKDETKPVGGYRRLKVLENNRDAGGMNLLCADMALERHRLALTKNNFFERLFALAPGKTEGDLERIAGSHPCITIPIIDY